MVNYISVKGQIQMTRISSSSQFKYNYLNLIPTEESTDNGHHFSMELVCSHAGGTSERRIDSPRLKAPTNSRKSHGLLGRLACKPSVVARLWLIPL